MEYESTVTGRSALYPDVEFTIARISLARRIELGGRVREIGFKEEFLESSGRLEDEVQVTVMRRRIDRMYLEWGLLNIRGLTIDGVAADVQALIDRGPEDLVREILDVIRHEIALSDAELKN